MTDQEHDQRADDPAEEREETLQDLDMPEEQASDVSGGTDRSKWIWE